MAKSQLQLVQERAAMLAKGYVYLTISELEQYRPVLPLGIVKRITSAIIKGRTACLFSQRSWQP